VEDSPFVSDYPSFLGVRVPRRGDPPRCCSPSGQIGHGAIGVCHNDRRAPGGVGAAGRPAKRWRGRFARRWGAWRPRLGIGLIVSTSMTVSSQYGQSGRRLGLNGDRICAPERKAGRKRAMRKRKREHGKTGPSTTTSASAQVHKGAADGVQRATRSRKRQESPRETWATRRRRASPHGPEMRQEARWGPADKALRTPR
jgi:hypothetical protein